MANDFTRGMAMMRKHNPQVQEDGFGLVRQVAAEHVHDLIEAYRNEPDHGLRCWLLELLGEARSPEALPIFTRRSPATTTPSVLGVEGVWRR